MQRLFYVVRLISRNQVYRSLKEILEITREKEVRKRIDGPMPIPSHKDQIVFLISIQRLPNEGSFVATYKYALLLSIADLCVEWGDDSGDRLRLPSR